MVDEHEYPSDYVNITFIVLITQLCISNLNTI